MKGFIGPISDDLPSLVAILLALSIFFGSLSFALNSYNEKIVVFNKIKGVMDIGRAVFSKGLLSSSDNADNLVSSTSQIASSYGLKYCIKLGGVTSCSPGSLTDCKNNWVHYTYLVAKTNSTGGINLIKLEVCGGD